MQTKVVREVKGCMIGEGQMSWLQWHFIQLFPYLSQMLQGIENCIILENWDTLEDLVCNLPSTFYSPTVLWTAPLHCWKMLCWHHWNTHHWRWWKRKSDCSAGTTEKIVLLHLCHWKKSVGATEKIGLLHWHHWKMLCWCLWNSCAGAAEKKNQTGEKIVLLHLCHWKKLAGITKKSDCSTSATEKCSAGAAEKNQTGEKIVLCHWKNRTAPLAPLKNALLAPLKHALLALLKKIKLLKKLYCFTSATEKNQQASLKKSDCSTSATEKYSVGICETRSAGTAGKKNQIALLMLLKKSDCSTGTTEIGLLCWCYWKKD